MGYVILTCRTLLWTLLTIGSTLAMIAALLSPYWLIGPPRRPGLRSQFRDDDYSGGDDEVYTPTLGIYNRCTKIHDEGLAFYNINCAPFLTNFSTSNDHYPDTWKACLIIFALALLFMTFTVITSVIGCCIRSLGRKSIFTISGTIQCLAGIFYIIALLLYACGWGSRRVSLVCGSSVGPFELADCGIGWAFYLAIGATFGTFLAAILSIQADVSTSSDKVQEEIFKGKNLICLP